MATGTNVASLALGNVAKAKIVISDNRQIPITVKKPVTIKATKMVTVQETTMLNGAITTTAASTRVATTKTLTVSETAMGDANTEKTFYVQFNPNSLTVSGYGGGQVTKTNFLRDKDGENGKSLEFEPANVRITMNVRLIFDQVDPQDAFMFDKLNTSYTSLATGAAKAALTVTGKKTVSVQKQVEGFIAAIRSKYTREISFNWGEMSYFGVLNRVSSQYTMFDVLGKPVRAYVDLSLVCADTSVGVNNMGSWQAAYEEAFEKDTSYVTSSQKASNLLNFSI